MDVITIGSAFSLPDGSSQAMGVSRGWVSLAAGRPSDSRTGVCRQWARAGDECKHGGGCHEQRVGLQVPKREFAGDGCKQVMGASRVWV